MNLDFNIFVFITGFIFSLPIIGYAFRFSIPVSLFFFIAGTFMIAVLLATDVITIDSFIGDSVKSIFSDIELHMNQLISSGSLQIYNSTSNIFIGEEITSTSVLNGETINTVCVFITKTNSPPGTLRVGVYDSSITPTFGNFKTSFAVVTATDLPVQASQLCYSIETPIILASGDIVGVYYDAGSSTNRINFLFQNTDVFDGTNSRLSRYSGSWIDATTNDARMIIGFSSVMEIENNTLEDNEFDFSLTGENYQLKVIMIFISVMFMVGGALVEVRQR